MDTIQHSPGGAIPVRGSCYLCAAYDIHAHQRSHICPFSTCDCSRCNIVRVRRAVVARQLRMRRDKKKAGNSSNLSYTCNRCRNHGLTVPKKGHKNTCPFESCPCPLCTLCHSRSILDASFRRNIHRKRVDKSESPAPIVSSSPPRRSHSALAAPLIESPSSSPNPTPSTIENMIFPSFSGSIPLASTLLAEPPNPTNPTLHSPSGVIPFGFTADRPNSFLPIPSNTFNFPFEGSFLPSPFLFVPAAAHNPVHYLNSIPLVDENFCPRQFVSLVRALLPTMKALIGYN